jgi:LysM repeat protein
VWRPILVLFATTVMSVGAGAPAGTTQARLTVDTRTGSLHTVLVPSESTLECDDDAHATGFLRHVSDRACALVRRGAVGKVAAAHRRPRVCADIYGGPQRAHITGRIGDRKVRVTVDRTDGCGIAEWEKLRALLGDPERTGTIPHRRVKAATTTTTPPTTYRVRTGDTLTEIAKRFRTSVQAIVTTNQLADPDHLADGQELVMPPPSAVRIDVELVESGFDSVVRFTLVGANPSELVTFVVTPPNGDVFTGPSHRASGYGVVTADYQAALGTGTYRVTATGSRGTAAETAFHLVPPG